jgi:UDP-glucose 4-epimerase
MDGRVDGMIVADPDEGIAITGGSGVLGACLVNRLKASGARDIRVFDQRPPANLNGIVYHAGSILRTDALEAAFRGCSVVFHLAALTDLAVCSADPLHCAEINTFGTACVLEASRRARVSRLVYASTGHVYGIPQRLPVDEQHPTRPCSVYGATKLAAEALIGGFAAAGHLTAVIARLANIYGPGYANNTVVGRAVEQTLRREPIQLRSLAEARDFLFVHDAAEALIRLSELARGISGLEIVNVSSGCAITIFDLVGKLQSAAIRAGLPKPDLLPPTGCSDSDVPKFFLSNAKLGERTGWIPHTALEDGLAETLTLN